ncbi:hypothetical protein SAMN05216262_10815 [Colwellia chukchiensis]|uniref:SnoaL-like domain-containing protein n=1 Tax=Colwellia chukchiensis TaxID=641665 RepID=A0A1H7NL92_9GAMM|nr:nuclear transport factor 2 family protein [Colwellia chukchiensis]SEL24266.1 hypothetical protein SAMN05216262_10815 [Colwellia chukchiensis]
MSNCITRFFKAWEIKDAETRLTTINSAVTESVQYSDPRTNEPLNGIEALSHYITMFSENAPGWSAEVVKSDIISGVTRVTVAFTGMGPDGCQQVQLGQYFVEKDGDLICRMIGFVGTGE